MNSCLTIVGVVGGVASGKSEVARHLEKLGAFRISADENAHKLLSNDPVIQKQIIDMLGPAVADEKGNLDRKKIADLVFGESAAHHHRRRALEAILHPAIRATSEQTLRQLEAQGDARIVILDAPLLVEAGWVPRCQAIVFVDTPLATRQKLAAKRGWDDDELSLREGNQASLDDKRAIATHIIVNDGNLDDLHRKIALLYQSLLTYTNVSNRP